MPFGFLCPDQEGKFTMTARKKAVPDTTTSKNVRYWLFKSEPESYSIDHLANDRDQTTFWDGVRNYQARNSLLDYVQVGDCVLFYHSNCDPLAIVGTMEVVTQGYPDPTAFDPNDSHYDPKSKRESPTWFLVDVKFLQKFEHPVTRETLLADAETQGMAFLQRGSRLSIVPVTKSEWLAVHRLAGAKPL